MNTEELCEAIRRGDRTAIAEGDRRMALPATNAAKRWARAELAIALREAPKAKRAVRRARAAKPAAEEVQEEAAKPVELNEYQRLVRRSPKTYGRGLRAFGEEVVMTEKQAAARQRLAKRCGY